MPTGHHLLTGMHLSMQIVFGALRVASSPAFFPMRLTLLKFLVHLSARTEVYIPLSTHVLEIFDAADLQPGAKQAKAAAAAVNPPPIEHVIKVSKQVAQSRLYLSRVVTAGLTILVEAFGNLAYSVAFPELAFPAEMRLRKFAKVRRHPHSPPPPPPWPATTAHDAVLRAAAAAWRSLWVAGPARCADHSVWLDGRKPRWDNFGSRPSRQRLNWLRMPSGFRVSNGRNAPNFPTSGTRLALAKFWRSRTHFFAQGSATAPASARRIAPT